MLEPEPVSRPTSSASSGSCLQTGLIAVLWFVIASIVFGRLASQLTATAALTQIPEKAWIAFPIIQGLVLVVLLLIVVFLWRSQPWRSIILLWLAASGYVLLLAPAALLDLGAGQAQALMTIALSLVYLLILYWLSNQRRSWSSTSDEELSNLQDNSSTGLPGASGGIWWLVFLTVPLFALPWLLWGALGSPIDTLLQGLAGLTFGWVVVASLQRLLLPGMLAAGTPRIVAYLLGGFAAGTAIMIFASGLGYAFGGIQTLLVLCLPALGWLAAGIWVLAGPWDEPVVAMRKRLIIERSWTLPAWLLIGLCAAFPLALIDPDELAIVISGSVGEILVWGLAAAATSGMIAISISAFLLVYLLATRNRPASTHNRSDTPLAIAALLAWVVALLVYFFGGQPGFFGEELFVQLESQADLSQAQAITDPVERRRFVYETLVQHADASQESLRASLERFNQEFTPYYLINGLRVRGGPLLRWWLSSQPGVAAVLDVPVLRPLPKTPANSTGSAPAPNNPEWNLTLIGADRVWQEVGVTGKGILIGQSDSGVQGDHPELADSYRGLDPDGITSHDYNWYDPWNATSQPTDIGGHGTHTLGSVLGDHTGVAPDAQWIACVNLARNLGNIPNYLDCMQFMLAPFPIGGNPLTDGDPTRGAQVLNNSWGCPEIEGCRPDSLLPAVNALTEAGIFVVSSAGNDGPLCSSLSDPIAIYDQSFSVAAANASGDWAFFSSVGPVTADGSGRVKPDILAPGEQVLSSMPGSTYGEMTGTSMAGPHVAGVVALMWSANPQLVGDIEQTRQILIETAQPYTGPLPDCSGAQDMPSTAVGYGMVDAYAAVKAAMIP